MEEHRQKVATICSQVQGFYERKGKFRIYHGSSNSSRSVPRTAQPDQVDTSGLNDVIAVDIETCTATVEANVPMDRLLQATLKHQLVPQVVVEFPGITAGGAFSGTAAESSSIKHGFFDQTVLEIEMVLADGSLVTCSKTENEDLFRGATGALGTLGVVTLLHLNLEKAKKYVEVTYNPVSSTAELVDRLRNVSVNDQDHIDFVDGILFPEPVYTMTSGAYITGKLTDETPGRLSVARFSGPSDPWFFMHVQDTINKSQSQPHTELVPLPDYIFRYNRCSFWCGKTAFDLSGLPTTPFTRRLLDRLMCTRSLYRMLHEQRPTTWMIVQDLAMPFATAEQFIDWAAENLQMIPGPLWLCPLRKSPRPTLHPHALSSPSHTEEEDKEPCMLNVGVYGAAQPVHSFDSWVGTNRAIESKVRELVGMKWSYAAQLYPEEEFWEQHNEKWYQGLRRKYKAETLPNIWQKTHHDVERSRKMFEEGVNFNEWTCIWAAIKSRIWREENARWDVWPPRWWKE